MNKIQTGEKMRIGVIGLGGIATRSHIPALLHLPGVTIPAGVEIDAYQADRTQKRFGIPKIYTTYQAMFEAEDLDAVYVCLPNSMHYQATSAALSHNLHVYCEKPVGISFQEAQGLAEQAEQRGLILMPGYHLRFHEHFIRARELFTQRRLGKILQIQASAVYSGPFRGWDPKSDWHLDKRSGGPLYDWGSHLLDLLVYISRIDIQRISGMSDKTLPGFPIEDSIVAAFQADKEVVGTINVAWGTRGNMLMLQFHGSAGSLLVSDDYFEHRTPMGGGLNKLGALLGNVDEILSNKAGALMHRKSNETLYMKSAQNFIDAIQGKVHARSAMWDAVQVHRVLGAISDSIDQDETVSCHPLGIAPVQS